ncbi:MAG: transglycosylase SLT domain-containing protein [Mucilaginibacter sp.]
MKRLLMCAISLCLLQAVKADPLFMPDSSHNISRAMQANIAASTGISDTVMVPVNVPIVTGVYQNNLYKRRLDSIQKDIPLDYNEYVQSYIDFYLYSRRNDISRVLGLSKYYFPIYEKAFREAGIPDEIEYLSIVESQLNPHAVSRVGATGTWQFMSNTARVYGLTMDNYLDERRDPIQSSYAAAAFLKDAYQEFGDWLLAIASYNCGRSNVIHAIEKAGGASDFWSIRQYLPVETRGYVPAYIAITYVMNYYKKYNIVPQSCNFSIKTDTVSVDKYVSLNSVSHVLNIDLSQLITLNPAYLQQIINGTSESPRVLVIPQAAKGKYASSYAALNSDLIYTAPKVVYNPPVEKPRNVLETSTPQKVNKQDAPSPTKKTSKSYISYRVQPGDTLPVIARKFEGASVEDIKELNGLKSEDVQPGMILNISKS